MDHEEDRKQSEDNLVNMPLCMKDIVPSLDQLDREDNT